MIYNDVNDYGGEAHEIYEGDNLRDVMLAAKNLYNEGFRDGQKTKNDEEYERGLNDVWNLVKRLHEIYVSERIKIFGTACVIEELSPREAVEKLKMYDAKSSYDEYNNIKREYNKWISEGYTPKMLADILDKFSEEEEMNDEI